MSDEVHAAQLIPKLREL